jgi:hypothetical protein
VTYTIAQNTTPTSRSATVLIGGQTLTVMQGSLTGPSTPVGIRIIK